MEKLNRPLYVRPLPRYFNFYDPPPPAPLEMMAPAAAVFPKSDFRGARQGREAKRFRGFVFKPCPVDVCAGRLGLSAAGRPSLDASRSLRGLQMPAGRRPMSGNASEGVRHDAVKRNFLQKEVLDNGRCPSRRQTMLFVSRLNFPLNSARQIWGM